MGTASPTNQSCFEDGLTVQIHGAEHARDEHASESDWCANQRYVSQLAERALAIAPQDIAAAECAAIEAGHIAALHRVRIPRCLEQHPRLVDAFLRGKFGSEADQPLHRYPELWASDHSTHQGKPDFQVRKHTTHIQT